MSVFKKKYTIEQINDFAKNCMVGHVGIEITEIGNDYLVGTMPVDQRTVQPIGILHGGASVVLAETLGSIAGDMVCSEAFTCVGMEINANHLRKVTHGKIIGIAKPIHLGSRTQVWDIRINTEEGKQVCISRLTLAVIERTKDNV
jgi:1,4-dihydroxy-2-naphthoyl-CoA hydrolase